MVRRDLGERFSPALTDDERGLAAEIVAPLLVPNSTYSEELTDAARDAAAEAVEPDLLHDPPGRGGRRGRASR